MPKAKRLLEIGDLLKRFRQHESITKELQKENTDLFIALACFDEAIEFCKSMEGRLKPTADIDFNQSLRLPSVTVSKNVIRCPIENAVQSVVF